VLSGLVEGANNITVTATDSAHNSATATAGIIYDSVPPTVNINPVTTPTNINSQTITGNKESGVNVAVTVNTSATVGAVSYPTSTTWSCTISNFAQELNTITVTAKDAAGNSAAVSKSITYDSIAPTVAITSPTTSPTNDNTPLLNYTVSDGAVVVKVDGVVVSKVSGNSLDTLSNGTHTVRVESTDAAGNTGFASVTFTVDTVPPTITINPVVTPTKLKSQTISGTMENGATVTVKVNTSATVGPVSYPTSTTWICTITNLVYGVNNITATAGDGAGNTAFATASITERTH
jgi:DNA-binding protein